MNKNRFNNQKRNTQKNIGQPCLEYRFRQVYRLVSSGLCRRQICIYDPLLACHPCKIKAGITVPYRQSIYRIHTAIHSQGVIVRETLIVILNECEGSVTVVGKAVRCHPSHRFFTPCHCPVSRLSHTAFLPPF